MASFHKIFKLSDDGIVRTHIAGFHTPNFSKERYDGDPLMAHLAIKYLRDLIDADHCAYLFDKNHELEDLGYLEDLRIREVARRKEEILAFNEQHSRWKATRETLLQQWLEQGVPIEVMVEGPAKSRSDRSPLGSQHGHQNRQPRAQAGEIRAPTHIE
jgi:hypothetical protein